MALVLCPECARTISDEAKSCPHCGKPMGRTVGEHVAGGAFQLLKAVIPMLGLLNAVGGVVAGIWLAVAGEWWAIGRGIVLMLVGGFLAGILMMPGVFISGLGMKMIESRRIGAARVVMAISTLYTTVLMTLMTLMITGGFLGHSRQASLFPMLLWTYAVSTSPWVFLATKDQEAGGNEFSLMSVMFLQAGFAIGAALMLISGDGGYLLLVVGGAMFVNWIVLQLMGKAALRADGMLT